MGAFGCVREAAWLRNDGCSSASDHQDVERRRCVIVEVEMLMWGSEVGNITPRYHLERDVEPGGFSSLTMEVSKSWVPA